MNINFPYMTVKYIRARDIHLAYAEKPEAMSTDGWGLDRWYNMAAIYLKRFIEKDF